MALERIGGTLRRVLEEAGLAAPLRGWSALEYWPEVVGEAAARRSRAVAFNGGRLIVEVDAPAWAKQLEYLKRTIVARLNARLGDEVIREIHFTPSGGGRA